MSKVIKDVKHCIRRWKGYKLLCSYVLSNLMENVCECVSVYA